MERVDKKTTGVGTAWNRGDPVTLIGDFRWMNYTASIDVMFEKEADNQYAQIGIRQTGRTHNILNNSGYSLKVNDDGTWTLYRAKLGSISGKNATELASGSANDAGDGNIRKSICRMREIKENNNWKRSFCKR